jgi:hypothetical protein
MSKIQNFEKKYIKKRISKALKEVEYINLLLDNTKKEFHSLILSLNHLAFLYGIKGVQFSQFSKEKYEEYKESLDLNYENEEFKLPREGWNSSSYN